MRNDISLELGIHAEQMFFTLGKVISDFQESIVDTWKPLKEIIGSDKSRKYLDDISAAHDWVPSSDNQKELFLRNVAMPLFEKYRGFSDTDHDLISIFEFMCILEDFSCSRGKTLKEAVESGEIYLPFEKDNDFYLNKLLQLNGEPQNLFEKFTYLTTGFIFYKNLVQKPIINMDDLLIILKIDRELGFIREEVAAFCAAHIHNLSKLKKEVRRTIEALIEKKVMEDELRGVMQHYKEQGRTFKSRDDFAETVERDKAIKNKQNPLKGIRARTIWNYYKSLGIFSDQDFQNFFSA